MRRKGRRWWGARDCHASTTGRLNRKGDWTFSLSRPCVVYIMPMYIIVHGHDASYRIVRYSATKHKAHIERLVERRHAVGRPAPSRPPATLAADSGKRDALVWHSSSSETSQRRSARRPPSPRRRLSCSRVGRPPGTWRYRGQVEVLRRYYEGTVEALWRCAHPG